jgi:protein O-mannosyl-transferase
VNVFRFLLALFGTVWSALPIAVRRWPRNWLSNARGLEPRFGLTLLPMILFSCVLYTRNVARTNFIFDEQEAVLANPYLRCVMDAKPKYGWLAAFQLDFWGREPEATIGSYRPLPNLVWRVLWWITEYGRNLAAGLVAKITKTAAVDMGHSPWLLHWANVLLHGVNGALISLLVYRLLKRRDVAWLAGLLFVSTAVLTEAVSGVVGLSDVLGTLGALVALCALLLPAWLMPLGVFFGLTVGLYSKESALCCVPLVPLGAFLLAPYTHCSKPRGTLRIVLALVAAVGAFVMYVELRRKLFITPIPTKYLAITVADKSKSVQLFARLMRWFGQPGLPTERLNNPLADAEPIRRIAGAFRVYARGLGQIVFPYWLSGDYSSPQEPVPQKLVTPEIVFGGLAMLLPMVVAPLVGIVAYLRYGVQLRRARRTGRIANAARALDRLERGLPPASPAKRGTVSVAVHAFMLRPRSALLLVAFALTWIAVSYFPVSNIPIALPTVRAERFWYFPAVGTCMILAVGMADLLAWARRRSEHFGLVALIGVQLFIAFQCFCARRHANDYADDLTFWESTRNVVTRSSKAHLNYSVMLGTRRRMDERIAAGTIAYQLEPTWAMASVYLGDAYCRSSRAPQAVEHYKRGFALGHEDISLLALGLQCLWDEKLLTQNSDLMKELQEESGKFVGSWYAYLVADMHYNGDKNGGVEPKHRPRGYNEGPREEKTTATSDGGTDASSEVDAGADIDAAQPEDVYVGGDAGASE